MNYSPRLKKAMQEIEAILKREDIAGSIVLHRPGFAEHLLHISPSYSCATIHHGTKQDHIRLKARSADHNGDKEKVRQLVTDTSNMMMHLSTLVGVHAIELMNASELLDTYTGAEHGPSSHSSHTEQNN